MLINLIWRWAAVLAVVFFLSFPAGVGRALAEKSPGEEKEEAQPTGVPAGSGGGLNIELKSDYMAGAQVAGEPGSFSFYQTGASVVWRWFDLSYKRRTYSWTQTERLPFGHGVDTPFKDLNTLALEVRHMDRLKNNWTYVVSGQISSSFEKETGPPAARVIGFLVVPMGDKLRVQLGGSVFYHPVRSYVFPMVGFVYGGKEDGPGSGFLVSVGIPRTTVGYRFNSNFTIRWSLEVDSTVYRLAESSKVESKGYVEPRDFKTGLFIKYTASDHFTVTAGGGYAFGRNLIFYDRDGEKTRECDVADAPYASLKMELRF